MSSLRASPPPHSRLLPCNTTDSPFRSAQAGGDEYPISIAAAAARVNLGDEQSQRLVPIPAPCRHKHMAGNMY